MSALRFRLHEGSFTPGPAESTLPPGPHAPRLFQTMRFAFRPLQTVEACAGRWGDWFTLRLIGGCTNVFCSHPDAIRDVHAGDPETFRAGEAAGDVLAPLLGTQSLLVLDGARHPADLSPVSPRCDAERVPFGGRRKPGGSRGGLRP